MVPTTRRNGKSPMTSEQELLEERLRRMENSMARMSGLVETVVQKQSRPLLLTDNEQADVLQAQLQAEQKKAAFEVAAGGTTEVSPEEKSADGSQDETHNPCNCRTTTARELVARTGDAPPPVVRTGGSRPTVIVVEESAQSRSVLDRLGLLLREPVRQPLHNPGSASEVRDPRS